MSTTGRANGSASGRGVSASGRGRIDGNEGNERGE